MAQQIKIKPRLAKGFRDFLPSEMLKRQYVIDTIEGVFQLFGYEPLQTPVLELRDTLFGKYGEDAEQLIYSAQHGRSKSDEVAMRYDLTVPLSRVVAQYENDISFPFRRYQISPVWRGERPQRGRYREFFQCDADIVGVSGMEADAEIISVMNTVYQRLNLPQPIIKINNRKLLTGMGVFSDVIDSQLPDLYRSIDKFDKIGAEGVEKELIERGIPGYAVKRMMDLVQIRDEGNLNLNLLERQIGHIEVANEGIDELRSMAMYLDALGVPQSAYEFDFTMVRGLSYYTGPIFETIIQEPNLGSITGGGRYDNLIGLFRRESLPTVGTSLGIERIIDIMTELDLFPSHVADTVVDILVTVFDDETQIASSRLASQLRKANIRAELYMSDGKFKLGKQFAYADKKGIPLVATLGPDEVANGRVSIKRLSDAKEVDVLQADVVDAVVGLMQIEF
ncbi:MAG: histidine--tRNA ligase [Anaerolineaceae bacterium]|nr:histidine--tRNA ligase [Anaerolineaceae bacterium]